MPGAYQCAAFLPMEEFSNRIESSDLLILHAGAGAVLHALRAGKKPVVVPRRSEYGEHVNNHQIEFSAMLASIDRVFLAEEIETLDKVLKEVLRLGRSGGRFAAGSNPYPPEPRMVALIREELSLHSRQFPV